MARKSNKTSHVLHLLAGEEPVPEAPEGQAVAKEPEAAAKTEEENQKPAQPPEDTPNVSIISAGSSGGDSLADLIKDQLEEAFPEEILNPASDSAAPDEQPDIANLETDGPAPDETANHAELPAEPADAQTEDAANDPDPQDDNTSTDNGGKPAAQNTAADAPESQTNIADGLNQEQPAAEQPEDDDQASLESQTDISSGPKSLSEMADAPTPMSEMANAPISLSEMADTPEPLSTVAERPQPEEANASDALTPQPKDNQTTAEPVPDIPDGVSDEETNGAPELEKMTEAEGISADAAGEEDTPQLSEELAGQTDEAIFERPTKTAVDQTPDTASAANDNTEPETAPHTEQSPLSRAHLDSVLYPDKDEAIHNYQFVNVMEYIIKDMVVDYMKKFDMCTCERCVVDTTALALTYCPAKYIVVDRHSVSPLLNYYANRYVGDVTVELTKACILVKENPRH